MLELGKAGSAGTQKGTAPLLVDGAVVGTLRTAGWREGATAVVGDRSWTFTRRGRDLIGRWIADPQDAVRLRARQTSWWRGTWDIDLEGTRVEMRTGSMWKGTHRFLVDGRPVAESGTTGGWAMRPTLTVTGALPLAAQVFLLWLEQIIRRRTTAVAAGVTGAGAVAAGGAG